MKSTDWFILLALVIVTHAMGCAAPASRMMSESHNPLREQVRESFGWTLKDSEAKAFLSAASHGNDSDDMVLETAMLAELAHAEKRAELISVWDRLWVNYGQIKRLLSENDLRENYPHSLVIIYYLLSAVHEPTWQRQSAQRLYQESLSEIHPTRLSGYALHYYCQGLVLNGKYQEVMPYMERLEQFTTPKVHAQNLHWIVRSAIKRKRFEMADHFFTLLIAYADRLNDESIHIECRKASALIIEVAPEEALQVSKQKVARYWPQIYKDHRPANCDRPKDQKVSKVQHPKSAAVKVKVIQAGREKTYVDPRLADISGDLMSNLRFSSFRQISCKETLLTQMVPFTMKLEGKTTLTMLLESVTASRVRIGLQINQTKKSVFTTTVDSVDQGTSIIGGPLTDGEMVVVWIRTKL